MTNIISLILGGGRGERLFPLTKVRAKPAIPLAGKYRLIDIPVSNCINSQIMQIYVLTQFNSASLNQHIANTYRFSPFMRGFVDVLAAQQTLDNPEWFQGTSDAVRKTLWMMDQWKVEMFLILSGDHLYRMDYTPFIENHVRAGADVSVSVQPVGSREAQEFGLVKPDAHGFIREFREKPKGKDLKGMEVDTTAFGFPKGEAATKPYLASMGIYVFNRRPLVELLSRHASDTDFGKHTLPRAIDDFKVAAYPFGGHWEDVGTIETYYEANLGLVRRPKPTFNFHDLERPIYTRSRFLPPISVVKSKISEALVADGAVIESAEIDRSVIGIRTRVGRDVRISGSLVLGADYYQREEEREKDAKSGVPPVGIGAGSVVTGAILDKNVRIGRNVVIENKAGTRDSEHPEKGYWIRGGIVIVTKDAVIPDGTTI